MYLPFNTENPLQMTESAYCCKTLLLSISDTQVCALQCHGGKLQRPGLTVPQQHLH